MIVTLEGVVYEIHYDKYNKFNNYAVVVAAEDKNAKCLTINSHVEGVKVVKIGKAAFKQMKKLEGVFTADMDSLVIDSEAFALCPSLKTFHTSADEVTVNGLAFYKCKKLISLWCKGVVKLRYRSFTDCDSLQDVGNLLIVEEESFVNCVSLQKLSFCDKVSVRGNVFKNTVISEVFCYGDVLLHNCATMDMFLNKTIHCKANSNLTTLVYEGANVIFW